MWNSKLRFLGWISVLTLTLAACKKEDVELPSGGGGNSLTFTPAAAPQIPGIIIPNTFQLKLHPGDVASLSAKVYSGTGVLLTGNPALSYSLTDNSIATLSGNQLTATQPGMASVEISDGTHNPASVLVEVVPDSVAIPASGFSITFSSLAMVVQSGSSQPIIPYTITNLSGQPVSASPVFLIENAALGSMIGNTINASSGKGMTRIRAILNGDTLLGHLTLLVQNNYRPTADTAWMITGVRVPVYFHYNRKVAEPVELVIHQAITPAGSGFVIPSFSLFSTTPSSVKIDDSRVLNQVNGRLISEQHGLTGVNAYYKDGSYFRWFAIVYLDLTGSWRFQNEHNQTVNFCFTQSGQSNGVFYEKHMVPRVAFLYHSPRYAGNSLLQGYFLFRPGYSELEGTFISEPAITYDPDNNPIKVGPIKVSEIGLTITTNTGYTISYFCKHDISKPDELVVRNVYQGYDTGPLFVAKLGTGVCVSSPQPTLSLYDLLTQNTNRIWYQSSVFSDYIDYGISSMQFLANGSYTDHTPYDTTDAYVQRGTTTWAASSDNQNLVLRYTLMVNYGSPGRDSFVSQRVIDTLRIASYSSSKFNIKGVHDGQADEYFDLSSLSQYLYWE